MGQIKARAAVYVTQIQSAGDAMTRESITAKSRLPWRNVSLTHTRTHTHTHTHTQMAFIHEHTPAGTHS